MRAGHRHGHKMQLTKLPNGYYSRYSQRNRASVGDAPCVQKGKARPRGPTMRNRDKEGERERTEKGRLRHQEELKTLSALHQSMETWRLTTVRVESKPPSRGPAAVVVENRSSSVRTHHSMGTLFDIRNIYSR